MKLPFAQSELQAAGQQGHHFKRIVDNAAAGLHEITRTVVQRSETSSSSKSSSTCDNDGADCHTPAQTQNTQNVAIILGVVIPVTVALVILIVLHRRHVKRQRLEDINDPHKSLDFGMEGITPTVSKQSKGRRKGPETIITNFGAASSKRKDIGLSMDMSMHIDSPYVLPAAMNGSSESIHSLSRSMKDPHDPYRPVTLMRPSTDNDSICFGRLNDNGSVYSMSTGHHPNLRENVSLVANARPMSQSLDKRIDSMSPNESMSPGKFPPRQMHSSMNRAGPPSRKPSLDTPLPEINEKQMLSSPITVPEPVAGELHSPPLLPPTNSLAPPRKDSMTAPPIDTRPESSNYGDDDFAPALGHPTINIPEPYEVDMVQERYSLDAPAALPVRGASLHPGEPVPAQNRLSVMGLRPLPPDVPDETPEVRANRIRSFYKEYFDDSKPAPGAPAYGGPAGPVGVTPDEVYDDYLDGVIYDPKSGGFYAPGARPYAETPVRRAMTPPPRGAMGKPRVSGGSSQGGYPHQRKFSAAYSTMSGGRPRGRSMPKKKLPPSPLSSLPTPHKLREDAQIFNPLDFAPPTSIRDLQNGRRPDSPLGTPRPYSPSVRAFTPLASSFDNLAVLPSPHDLRKSGTFTALDFAPPSKIRDPMLSPSDSGSIRSNRSGISAMQRDAVREGAYRVSRIPKETVTTRDDLSQQLRPKMDLTSYA